MLYHLWFKAGFVCYRKKEKTPRTVNRLRLARYKAKKMQESSSEWGGVVRGKGGKGRGRGGRGGKGRVCFTAFLSFSPHNAGPGAC